MLDLGDHAVDAAPAVRREHPRRGAEGAAEGAAARGHDVGRLDGRFEDRVVGEGDRVEVADRLGVDDGVGDPALDDVKDDGLGLADHDLVNVGERLLRARGGVDAAHDDARVALLAEHPRDVAGARERRGHGVEAEHVGLAEQAVVAHAAVELLIHLDAVSRLPKDAAEDERPRDGVGVSVEVPAEPVEGVALDVRRGRDEGHVHASTSFRLAMPSPTIATVSTARRTRSSSSRVSTSLLAGAAPFPFSSANIHGSCLSR